VPAHQSARSLRTALKRSVDADHAIDLQHHAAEWKSLIVTLITRSGTRTPTICYARNSVAAGIIVYCMFVSNGLVLSVGPQQLQGRTARRRDVRQTAAGAAGWLRLPPVLRAYAPCPTTGATCYSLF